MSLSIIICKANSKLMYRYITSLKQCTVTSRLFTHTVSTEKSRKEMRDRKDTRGIKHTYYNGSFFLYCF